MVNQKIFSLGHRKKKNEKRLGTLGKTKKRQKHCQQQEQGTFKSPLETKTENKNTYTHTPMHTSLFSLPLSVCKF